MSKTITLHRTMGAEILNHLRQFGDLPDTGILAGQAVDSAITDLYGHGGGVYNDLDIFRNVPSGRRRDYREFATETAGRATIGVQQPSDYSGMELAFKLVQSYAIKSVSRKGMLNFVNCSMDAEAHTRQLTSRHVLNGFDLNCTRVGIDLSTGELHWDRHYEDFLRSRQLRIVMMHTPWHTFLRMAKKSQELPNVYVDLDAAAEACVAVANSLVISDLKGSHNVSLLFGERQKAQAEAMRSIWTPYFNLESRELHQVNSAYWQEESKLSDAAKETEHKIVLLHELKPRGELNPALQKRCDRLGPTVLFFAQRTIDDARRAKPGTAYDKLDALTKRRQDVAIKPEADFVLACARMFDTAYVQGQALPEVGDKVAAWLAKHGGFMRPFIGMTLAQQHQTMLDVTALSREFGDLHYNGDSQAGLGVLESEAHAEDLLSKERMLAILEADYVVNGVPFEVTPLPLPKVLPARFKGFVVRELLNGNSLRREGKDMHHCVGGYSTRVRENMARIVSIKYKDEVNSHNCSTIEWSGKFEKAGTADMKVRIVQNRTLLNKDPSDLNKALAEYLKGYLAVAHMLTDASDLGVQAEKAWEHGMEVEEQRNAALTKYQQMQDELVLLKARCEAQRKLTEELKSDAIAAQQCSDILSELAKDSGYVRPQRTLDELDTLLLACAGEAEAEHGPTPPPKVTFMQRLRTFWDALTVRNAEPPIPT